MGHQGITFNHWGASWVEVDGSGRVRRVVGVADDPDVPQLTAGLERVRDNRVLHPSVRASWLRHGPFARPDRRGRDPHVEVSWDEALDLVAHALRVVREESGNGTIFAGSYGWASAGRFHHAQSQLKRFMNCIGGYVGSTGTYSHGAAEAVIPRVLGVDLGTFLRLCPPIDEIVDTTRLVISLGGFPAHNAQITSGGDVQHWYRPGLRRAAAAGCGFVSVSPTLGAFDRELHAEWLPIRPGTDAALLIGLAGEIVSTGHEAAGFLGRYCTGFDAFRSYLTGAADGVVRDAAWAAEICGLDATAVRSLAGRLLDDRTLLNCTWSVQRVEAGEQAVWALVALGAVVGRIGMPGAGIAFGLGSMGSVGAPVVTDRLPSLPQGRNPVRDSIPVARIADALLHPGGAYRVQGERRAYPRIELVYWCGGNPFHHHQNLARLHRAWQRPRAIVVHEPFWTQTARRADVVLPASLPLEREDLGGSSTGRHLVRMRRLADPPGSARDDHAIFRDLAHRLGVQERFTGGRTPDQWLEWLYGRTRQAVPDLPGYAEFRARGMVERPPSRAANRVGEFLAHPDRHPLGTPSGRIELAIVDAQALLGEGAAAHPAWVSPREWLGRARADEYHLVSPMPADRLHSQFATTEAPGELLISPRDAAGAGLGDGERVWVGNRRGEFLARVRVTRWIQDGVVAVANGAPLRLSTAQSPPQCRGGNPNVCTSDRPTSPWAQASTAHSCLVTIRPDDTTATPG